MATPKINENCHHMQNHPHKCKTKLEKFHSDILCRFGVIKESLLGGGIRPPPGEIGLTIYLPGYSVRTRKYEAQSFSYHSSLRGPCVKVKASYF